MPELNDANALDKFNTATAALQDNCPGYPEKRGIVICAGGMKYFVCAWVCINMLRKQGCSLPIEVWHLGSNEMPHGMHQMLLSLDVRIVDAHEVRKIYPARILNGWELKPYAMIHSRFAEVLSMDADNVPLIDPAFLFETPQYQHTGAIFWPDRGCLAPSRRIWKLSGIAYRNEPEVESGQIVIDKQRCWKPLNLTMWMNEHSDFWYRHIHGDKETFHICWRKLNQAYTMPPYGLYELSGTLCQHDFEGRRIFQHRNGHKWSLERNHRVSGFQEEQVCLDFIAQLEQQWPEVADTKPYKSETATPEERKIATHLTSEKWLYERIGYDVRTMVFLPNGRIGEGSAKLEKFWNVRAADGAASINIIADRQVTCRLKVEQNQIWRGRWERYECMPVELKPHHTGWSKNILEHRRDYSQFGEQARILEFFGYNFKGCFIDIGASDGVLDSNTRALFERGWTGTLIEPVPEVYWRLEDNYVRAEGIQLVNAAVSGRNGFGEMWVCRRARHFNGPADNRNTMDPRFAKALGCEQNPAQYELREVRTITVATLMKLLQRTAIDLLCVDTEGMDYQIVRGLLELGLQPRLVVWEADKDPSDVIAMESILTQYGLHEVFRTQANRGWGR